MHIGATALHYGQTCFEGRKAFCHEDGEVYVFRPEENANQMQSSCCRTMMPELPTKAFLNAIQEVVSNNIEYVLPTVLGAPFMFNPCCLVLVLVSVCSPRMNTSFWWWSSLLLTTTKGVCCLLWMNWSSKTMTCCPSWCGEHQRSWKLCCRLIAQHVE